MKFIQKMFYQSVLDGATFSTEEEAIRYAVQKALDYVTNVTAADIRTFAADLSKAPAEFLDHWETLSELFGQKPQAAKVVDQAPVTPAIPHA